MIRKLLFFFFLVLGFHAVNAQILVMPAEIIISSPTSIWESASCTVPAFAKKNQHLDLSDHYKPLMTEEINEYLQEDYEDIITFDPMKSPDFKVDFFYDALAGEYQLYQAENSWSLIPNNQNIRGTGQGTKKYVKELSKHYKADYIVFVSIMALHQPTRSRSYEEFEFKGNLSGYAWIVDAKTGMIVSHVHIKNPKSKSLLNNNQSEAPAYRKTNEKSFSSCNQKIYRKLSRRINKLWAN